MVRGGSDKARPSCGFAPGSPSHRFIERKQMMGDKKELFGMWVGYGKRLKHDADSRMRYTIYDMVFEKRIRIPLTKKFIKEAGLDNDGTYEACKLSLKTDFGLHVQEIGGGIEYSKDENLVEAKPMVMPYEPPLSSKSKAKGKSKAKTKASK